MFNRERNILKRIYSQSKGEENLPWHRTDPMPLLTQVVEERNQTARALDLGCGTGVDSAYLAKQGYEVTGIDFLEQPLQMARERAQAQDVEITFLCADVLKWETMEPFDLIFDAGCLHSLNPADRPAYRNQLKNGLQQRVITCWFISVSDIYWIGVHAALGPDDGKRKDIIRGFSPDFVEREYTHELKRNPLPVGPLCLIASYWFQRAEIAT